jgi:hypothetical protein
MNDEVEFNEPDFFGQELRECGEHRTVGSHRAWCFDCSEWCYPRIPCRGCEIIPLRTFAEFYGYSWDKVIGTNK